MIGKRLVPLLRANGHEVVGTTRSPGKVDDLRALGAEPRVLDVLDAVAVGKAVSEARPEVVVHQATALSDLGNLRNLDEAFADTNRLRTEGTDNLLAAAQAAGAEGAKVVHLARRSRRPHDLVAVGTKQRHEPLADHSCCSCDQDPHDLAPFVRLVL